MRRPLGMAVGLAALLSLASPRGAFAGPPFITDDPEPVDPGHWEVYAFSDGALEGASTTGVGPSVEVNYGAAPSLQLHFIGNLAYDAPAGQARQYGLGDTELARNTGSSTRARTTGTPRSESSRWSNSRPATPSAG